MGGSPWKRFHVWTNDFNSDVFRKFVVYVAQWQLQTSIKIDGHCCRSCNRVCVCPSGAGLWFRFTGKILSVDWNRVDFVRLVTTLLVAMSLETSCHRIVKVFTAIAYLTSVSNCDLPLVISFSFSFYWSHDIVSEHSAIGLLLWLARRSGTHWQMNCELTLVIGLN